MTVTASALRELHRIHKQLTDLRSRLDRGPRQIKAGEMRVEMFNGELDAIKAEFTKARVASDEKQLQLKQREDRIEDLKKKLNTASSNKEFQTLKEQIAADQQANSVLSDEILESLEKIDEIQVSVKEAEEKLKTAQEELDRTRKHVEAEQQGLKTECERVAAELDQAEGALPVDFKVEYERIARARGEDALAQVDGECCGGCFQTLTPQTMNELYMSKPVFCKACGCLLYLAEDRTPGR